MALTAVDDQAPLREHLCDMGPLPDRQGNRDRDVGVRSHMGPCNEGPWGS